MTDDDGMGRNQQHLPWNEGLPTKPEVDALLRAFPPESILPGKWRVEDSAIKAIVNATSRIRYRTVYTAWIRRLERDHGVIVWRDKERGFMCPTPDQVYARTHPTLAHAGRAIGKQLRQVSRSKPETETQKVTQEHQGKLLYIQKRELKKARMNTLPSSQPQSQPQIPPPKKSRNKD